MVTGALVTMTFFFAYTQVRTAVQNVVFACVINFCLNIYYGMYSYFHGSWLLLSFATSSLLSLPFAFSLFRSLFSSLVLSSAPPVLLSFHPRPPLHVAACVPDAILKRNHQPDTKLATLYAYTPEVLPSAHRGTGNGIAIGWNRIMGILSAVIATVADVSFLLPLPTRTTNANDTRPRRPCPSTSAQRCTFSWRRSRPSSPSSRMGGAVREDKLLGGEMVVLHRYGRTVWDARELSRTGFKVHKNSLMDAMAESLACVWLDAVTTKFAIHV